MRSWRYAMIPALAVLLTATSVHARPQALSKRFETDKKLGVGLMLGVPLGVNAKYLFLPELAVDLGVGGYLAYRDRDGFHMHADLLWQPFVAVEGQSFLAPFYTGLGARLLRHDGITHMGVRVPVGISFDFASRPFDIFVEAAFVYDISMSEGGSGAVDMNALLGLRYFFF